MDDEVRHDMDGSGTVRPGILRAVLRMLAFAAYLSVVSVIAVFALLEIPAVNAALSPDLPYYTLRRTYAPDSVLAFRPVFKDDARRVAFSFRGDLFSEDFGVRVEPIAVDVTYDTTGFRSNRTSPPWDIAVIGDSYIELSETDTDSFSEQLAAATGRSTINLGTAWYGPYQYVEILKDVLAGPQLPRLALLMFYAGNDMSDIDEYERWRAGGNYYGHDRRYWDGSLPTRFAIVVAQTKGRLRSELGRLRRRLTRGGQSVASEGPHPALAYVRLADSQVPMVLSGSVPEAGVEALLERDSWRTLRRLMSEFQRRSVAAGVTPVVVYLPSKSETYAEFIDGSSGAQVLAALEAQRASAEVRSAAVQRIASDSGFCFIDVLAGFRALTTEGELLYHPFDTHWNGRGRQAGAEIVAASLGAC